MSMLVGEMWKARCWMLYVLLHHSIRRASDIKYPASSLLLTAEERQIRLLLVDPLHVKRDLACVVIAPHARLAARHFAARRNLVPAVRPMINAVQNQALMVRVHAQIRLGEKRAENREAGLPVPVCLGKISGLGEVIAEPQQALRGDRSG